MALIDYIVREPQGPWRGATEQDGQHFTEIMRGVEGHWADVLLLLIGRVADDDDWVRTVARRALVHVAGVDHGEGEAAQARWRSWMESRAIRRAGKM